MNIEPTNETDVVCKDLIGESYEAAYKKYPDGMFGGLNVLWDKIQKALDQKGALDMCTTSDEDNKAMDILEEVFEEACREEERDGQHLDAFVYVDYQKLWERICAVLEVKV